MLAVNVISPPTVKTIEDHSQTRSLSQSSVNQYLYIQPSNLHNLPFISIMYHSHQFSHHGKWFKTQKILSVVSGVLSLSNDGSKTCASILAPEWSWHVSHVFFNVVYICLCIPIPLSFHIRGICLSSMGLETL